MGPKYRICYFFAAIFLLISIHSAKTEDDDDWEVDFDEYWPSLYMGSSDVFNLNVSRADNSTIDKANIVIRVISSNPEIVKVSEVIADESLYDHIWEGHFEASPVSLGSVNLSVEISNGQFTIELPDELEVSVYRNRVYIFEPYSVYYTKIFTPILYVFFGFVLNLKNVKEVFKTPKGLGVAFLLYILTVQMVSYNFYHKN